MDLGPFLPGLSGGWKGSIKRRALSPCEFLESPLSYSFINKRVQIDIVHYISLDRVPKKSKFAEWPAEFSVYFWGKYKNFLLTKFLKIFQNALAHQ